MSAEQVGLRFPGLCPDCPLLECKDDRRQHGQAQAVALQGTAERLGFEGKARDFVFIQPHEESSPLSESAEDLVKECIDRQFNGDCIVFRTFVNRLPESKIQ